MTSFPGYERPAALRWRNPTSWKELRDKYVAGVRIRWPKRDAFLSKAPEPPTSHRNPDRPSALSADARLDEITEWREGTLSWVGKTPYIKLPDGATLNLKDVGLKAFEVLIQPKEGKQ